MIQIDEEAIEYKPFNQLNKNGKRTSVWVHNVCFYTYKNGKSNGWLFEYYNKEYWLDFHENGSQIIGISIDRETKKITEKVIKI